MDLPTNIFTSFISPFQEIMAYEALWNREKASFKSIAELFAAHPSSKPSDFVKKEEIERVKDIVTKQLNTNVGYKANLLINNSLDYPAKLNDAADRVELLYYSGNLDLIGNKSVAIVGTRNPSEEGLRRTEKLVKLLVKDDYTIISGLAQGIDTKAHQTTISQGGKTIAVIGTPITSFYPKENESLQRKIAKEYLLISQVPFYRYSQQGINGNRLFFPERNKTMSALSDATIIVEAGETSGTLIQARAAIQQNRKLFILDSNFKNNKLTWPARYEKMGAIRVREYSDIINALK